MIQHRSISQFQIHLDRRVYCLTTTKGPKWQLYYLHNGRLHKRLNQCIESQLIVVERKNNTITILCLCLWRLIWRVIWTRALYVNGMLERLAAMSLRSFCRGQSVIFMTVKIRPIKCKASLPVKIAKLFQFQNSVCLIVVARCYNNNWNLNTVPVVNAMHDGHDLIHPLG